MILVIIKHLQSYLETFITKKMTIDEAEIKQDEFNSILRVLRNYAPKSQKYIEAKNSLLGNAKNFYEGREKIIKGFKDGIFPLKSDDEFEEQQTSKIFDKKEPPEKPTKTDIDECTEFIIKEETGINRELFKNYFSFEKPTVMLKNLYDLNDKNKNKKLVDVIKSGLIDLKNEIKRMSKDEIKIEKPY